MAEEASKLVHIAAQDAAWQACAFVRDTLHMAYKLKQEDMRAKIASEEVAETFQQVVLDFTVLTFGAGLVIQSILTGFESCQVQIRNLPLDVTHNEVCALFTQQGMDTRQFHVVRMNKTPDRKHKAEIICQEDLKGMAIGLNGVEFRQQRLVSEISQNGSVEGMRASVGGPSDVLTISWHAPSVSFMVTYDMPQAKTKVRELDRKICDGCRVKVEMHKPPAGQYLSPNAVIIRGLHPSVTDDAVAQLSGLILLRCLKLMEYDTIQVFECFRHHIEAIMPGHLRLFESVATDATDGICMARAHLKS